MFLINIIFYLIQESFNIEQIDLWTRMMDILEGIQSGKW